MSLLCYVKVTSSHTIASQHIQKLLEAYDELKILNSRKGIYYLCKDRIEKSAPKPCDAKQWSLGRIFLSHSHTHDSFL